MLIKPDFSVPAAMLLGLFSPRPRSDRTTMMPNASEARASMVL